MIMTFKGLLLIFILLLFSPASTWAQVNMTGDLSVLSNPEGAQVVLKGEAKVSGVTPSRFRHLLIGEYQLTLKKHGYETYKTNVLLDPVKQLEVNVTLTPKTRFKAAARSLLIPGWGQRYSDQKTKGFVYTLLSAGAATCYFIADNDFDNKNDTFKDLRNEYDSLAVDGNIGQLQDLYPRLVKAQEDAFDAESIRRITIGSFIGIWGLNVLDALFFFPEEKGTFTIKGLTFEPDAGFDNSGMTLSLKF